MLTFTNWLKKAFSAFSQADPCYTKRLEAFKKLHQPSFIRSQKENYRNIRELLALWIHQPYHLHIPSQSVVSVGVNGYGSATGATSLTFVNGIYISSKNLDPGVRLQRLIDLPEIKQKEILNNCMTNIGASDDLFLLLSKTLYQRSYLLEIETEGSQTVILQHIITDGAPHIVPQLFLKVGKNSQVTIIENWHTVAQSLQPCINNFTHILLEKSAHLAYHSLYVDHPCEKRILAHQVNSLYCHQKNDSHFTHHSFAFGTATLRIHLNVQINGSNAHTALYGLSTLGTTEQIAHQIQVIHNAPHSFSKQHYKSILSGSSTSSFSGKIYLTPDAQQTNGYQTNNVLLLSDKANHYTKPQLEIYADDVKCSHGATAGQLDETQLFYLQTRGIAAPLAKKLLLEAFGSEIIHSLSLATLQDYLCNQLVAKLVKL